MDQGDRAAATMMALMAVGATVAIVCASVVAYRLRRRFVSPHFRSIVSLFPALGALTAIGMIQVLAPSFYVAGWISEETVDFLVTWVQIPFAMVALYFAIQIVRRFLAIRSRLGRADALMSSLHLDHVAADVKDLRLTRRQEAVLIVMGTGAISNEEIAGSLSISPQTARKHVQAIMEKADVHDRRALLAYAPIDESVL